MDEIDFYCRKKDGEEEKCPKLIEWIGRLMKLAKKLDIKEVSEWIS
jgi:hypothetical protein